MNKYVLYNEYFGYVTELIKDGVSFDTSEPPLLFEVENNKSLKKFVATIYTQTGVELDIMKANEDKEFKRVVNDDKIKELIS